MPLVTISMGSDPKDPTPVSEAPHPVEIYISNPKEAKDIFSFLTCLATKTDVLVPAVVGIIGCATKSLDFPKAE